MVEHHIKEAHRALHIAEGAGANEQEHRATRQAVAHTLKALEMLVKEAKERDAHSNQ